MAGFKGDLTSPEVKGKTVGVDGCRAGWFAVWGHDGKKKSSVSSEIEFGLFRNFQTLWEAHHDAHCILVDIPIGLTENIPRRIEPVMRRMLGAKSSSVFPVPCRAAVYADDYGLACAENQAHYGKKISRQAWNICPKIREMNQFLQGNSGSRGIVGESHPELTFAMLAGKVLISSKKSEIGIRQRLATLGRYKGGGADVYDAALDKYLRKDVARDDVVDAMALQIAAENAVELNLNEQQQTGDGGIRVEMHVPSQASLLSSPDYI